MVLLVCPQTINSLAGFIKGRVLRRPILHLLAQRREEPELLYVSPKDVVQDEQFIAKGYRKQLIIMVVVLAAGWASTYVDLKTVIVAGFLTIFCAVSFAESRLYDLCVRIKRTNYLLHEQSARLAALERLDARVFDIINVFDLEKLSTDKTAARRNEVFGQIQELVRQNEARGSANDEAQ